MEKKAPLRLRGLVPVEVLGFLVPVASSPCSRLLGLALLERGRSGAGLLLPRCRSVHTFGMFFDLDIRFIDPAGHEIRTVLAVPPGRILFERLAAAVLEVPAEGGE
jgi:uncharacterized membrane protein (UPF0127 family)